MLGRTSGSVLLQRASDIIESAVDTGCLQSPADANKNAPPPLLLARAARSKGDP